METDTTRTPSLVRLPVDRWRFRDTAASIHPDGLHALELDAAPGSRIPLGVVPVAAGLAFGQFVCGQHREPEPSEAVLCHHRRTHITVTYGPAAAGVGETLSLQTVLEGSELGTVVRSAQGVIATILQRMDVTAVLDDAQVVGGGSPSGDAEGEDFSRVRNARWCYVAGEMCATYGDHVAATGAGLAGALVPESLLLGLVERRLFDQASVPSGRLEVELAHALLAGSFGEVGEVSEEPGSRSVSIGCGDKVVATGRLVTGAHTIGPVTGAPLSGVLV